LIVAGRGEVHHFDGAAGQSEGHGPEGALTGPIGYLVECCSTLSLIWLVKKLPQHIPNLSLGGAKPVYRVDRTHTMHIA
jgi:hypothetical protein